MQERVLQYYKRLIAASFFRLTTEALAAAALEYLIKLLPDAAPEYLQRQPWQYLAIGLYANRAQVCGQCLQIKHAADFARLLDFRSICGACCQANRKERKKEAIANEKAKRYARRLADGYLTEIGTSDAVRRRYLDTVFGPRGADKSKRHDPVMTGSRSNVTI